MSSRLDPYALVGATFRERYSLEGFVGIGRFTAVYRGADAETRRPVAVRLLKVRATLPPSQREGLLRRLRILCAQIQDVAVRCPTLAGVLDVGAIVTPEGRWMAGLVQPWLSGDTLEAVIEEDRRRLAPPRTLGETIEWMTPVADALSCAHASGLVHGSLAPRNVFVREATVELLDLGVAAALAELQAKEGAFGAAEDGPLSFFVPAYGSPEHFSAAATPRGLGALGPAADVFALALLIVELLARRAPLGDGDDAQLEAAARDLGVRPTPRARGRDLGGPVEAIFERALAVHHADRYATVESFWSALRAASRWTLRARASAVPPSHPHTEPPPRPSAAPPPLPQVAPPPLPFVAPPAAELFVTRAVTPPRSSPPPVPPASKAPPASPSVQVQAPIPMRSEQASDSGADDPEIGSVIAGKYCIERLLGRGGMGSVWLCRHLGLGERVAVKLMCRKLAVDPDVRARFEREARAAARIKSRYVARVYDTGELADLRPYIVMEYMEGETLAQALLRTQTLSLADTVRILGQVGRGLARAHELGIVHRDIKPDNVFLAHTADDGVLAKVFDFGIVKVSDAPNDGATRDGVLIGTPQYMSPEQADGLAIDHRSDIYSVGVVAFRMLTGKRPFNADSVLGILVKICGSPLPSLTDHAPWVPPAVDAWFRRTCARDRTWRFTSVIECVDALAKAAGIAGGEALRDVSVLPPPPSLQATAPHEQSCPTLLDEVADVLEGEPSGDFLPAIATQDAADADPDAPRQPFRTNPLFDGERPSVVPESTLPPHALDRAPTPRRRRGFGWRATFAAIVAGASLIALALLQGFSTNATSATSATREGTISAAAKAPPPAPPPAAPPAATPSTPSNALPVRGTSPVAKPFDAGLPTSAPPPRPGRSRRAASATSR